MAGGQARKGEILVENPKKLWNYPVLSRLMAEEYVGYSDIAKELKLPWQSVQSKLKGTAAFLEKEQQIIQKKFFPEVPVDELFQKTDDLIY